MNAHTLRGLSLKEAAELAGCSEHHMRKLVQKGEVPSYRLGALYMVPSNFIEVLIAKEEARRQAEAAA